MAISSPGFGSGLDVNSIVSQLVALERQPLQTLQTKASTLQSRLSLYGTIKSQVSALGDAATALTKAEKWAIQKSSSTNPAAATVTTSATVKPTSFSLDVGRLAQAQTTSSKSLTIDAPIGSDLGATGKLSIQLGSWGTNGTEGWTAGALLPIEVDVTDGDTYTEIAAAINAKNAGVKAIVLRSGGSERLSLQSTSTGDAAGFQVTSVPGSFSELDSLSFTSQSNAIPFDSGMQSNRVGLNSKAYINGVEVGSATNTLADVVPGVTLKLTQATAVGAPVQITVEQDQETLQKNVQALADAYNAINKTIADATRYVPGGRSGPLQGDSTTLGIQSVMRSIVGSASIGATGLARLSDAGLELQTDGSLKLNSTKLADAFKDPANLEKLFVTDNSNASTNGFGLKFRDFSKGLIAADGRVSNKSTALQGDIKRNTDDQDRVNARAARVEKQLRAQYSALDTQLARMSSLSSYVNAQVARWNNP